MFNLFTRKRDEIPTYQSVVSSTQFQPQQNMSVNPLFSSKTQNYSQGLFSTPSRLPQTQNTINTSLMSIAPKTQNMSYNDPKRFDLNRTPAPKPQTSPPQVNPMAQYTKNIDDYFKKMSDQSAQRVAQEEQARQKQQEFLNQRYGLMNDQIRGSIPVLKSNFDTFKGNTQAGVADVVAKGEAQKEQARDYFGEATRTAAQARGETQQQATQKFASQGAIDSAGAGSYRQANENIDSDFNAYVQKNSKELAYKLTDIDSAVGEYQRQATTLIQTEEAKLQESLRQIEFTLADNEIAKKQAIEQVYQQYQDRINSIQDTLSAIEQQAIEQKNNIALELDKLSKTTLSPEFRATLVPTTEAELDWLVKNQENLTKMGLLGDQSGDKNKGQVVATIQRLAGGNIGGITGYGRWNPLNKLPGSDAQQTENDWKNLQAMLSLEGREKLKGSGAISDFEAKVLERASTLGLGTNLSEDQFRQRLNILMNEISGGQIQPSTTGNNIITAPDGQQVMIVD